MKTSQIYRRLEKLSAKIRPIGEGGFTLEELCRLYWRIDKRRFKAVAKQSATLRFFLNCFEREEAERGDRTRRSPE